MPAAKGVGTVVEELVKSAGYAYVRHRSPTKGFRPRSMRHFPQTIGLEEATDYFPDSCRECAVIENPNNTFPPYEVLPLVPKQTELPQGLSAIVMDMDGTTTTTEPLCIHSLETLVRQITGKATPEQWEGLDPDRDYPRIIGNSTTKHVEYLIRTYGEAIDPESFRLSIVRQAVWTLENSRDEGRKREVMANLRNIGAGGLLEDSRFVGLVLQDVDPSDSTEGLFSDLAEAYLAECDLESFGNRVTMATDIYYRRYHEILLEIQAGESARLAEEITGFRTGHPIEPMPGAAVFLALAKGWLGEEAALLGDLLKELLPSPPLESDRRLQRLGRYFERFPARIGVVTSSIRYEAEVVLGELFRVLRTEIQEWPVSHKRKEKLLDRFESPERFYDAIVTATDSHEIRLKPHRDLYTIALRRLGVSRNDRDKVLGLEDSESGILALRAAGIPLSVAVPFLDSTVYRLDMASHLCAGGLPEVVLDRQMFLPENHLKSYSLG